MTSVVRGDALAIPLRDKSVDLIVTSPPYFALRSYRDDGDHYGGQIGSEATPLEFVDALWAVTRECWRVLKDTGSLFVNLGDKYAGGGGGPDRKRDRSQFGSTVPNLRGKTWGAQPKSLLGLPWRYAIGCVDGAADPDGRGWVLRSELVWSKPNALPESVTDRVRRSHEQWFHLTKGGTYYAAVDELREPTLGRGLTWEERRELGDDPRALYSADSEHGHGGTGGMASNPLGKLPGSVWSIASEPLVVPEHLGVDHFAAFPSEWPRRLVLGWSPPGVCACGEPLRPVVDVEREVLGIERRSRPARQDVGDSSGDRGGSFGDLGTEHDKYRTRATITGYARACGHTSPTTPAVVLDPFGGTGTTAMVARALGRTGVSLDLSADYCRLARWRVFDSDGAARVVDRTMGERQGVLPL